MRLLLVEDSVRLQQLLAASLRGEAYRVDVVGTVEEFNAAVRQVAYDLFIIDITLPDGNGIDVIREIRQESSSPILVITAQTTIAARVNGLDSGADDYLVKPFHTDEFLARVRALMRRPTMLRPALLEVGGLSFDPASSEVRIAGQEITLRPSERQLLALLMRRADLTVPKEAIDHALSDFDRGLSANAIEVLVYRLRRALSEHDTRVTIETVRGIGYRLKVTGP